METEKYRVETDLLGQVRIPKDAYYGCQTKRALENFQITGINISSNPELIVALAQVKKAAAITNNELGLLSTEIYQSIEKACDEIIMGKLHDQFVVDVYQGGAGTSTNMNANEVIANRALEHMGQRKGEYQYLHPNSDVNCSQSTNDVYPTALRIALTRKLETLMHSLALLKFSFEKKAEEFHDVIKMGRTQLQDAVPMTMGQEFGGYATTIGEDISRIKETQRLLHEVNLGATAIGTGLNTPLGYRMTVLEELRKITCLDLVSSKCLIEATWDTGAFVQLSGVLKRVAVKLSKICNDLRLLSSGPKTGFNEIQLPAMQLGSSIMPGKVNPVIPEVVNQIAYQIIGADVSITMASESGQLELNAMEPVIAYNLLNSIGLLAKGSETLAEKCIQGISANKEICQEMVNNSIGVVTALNPIIGYANASRVAKIALESDRSVTDVVLSLELMTREELNSALSMMTSNNLVTFSSGEHE